MRSLRPAVWLAVLLLAVSSVACGGDEPRNARERREKEGGGDREGNRCPERLPFQVKYWPKGFEKKLHKGVGGGKDEIKDVTALHMRGANKQYIDVFRGGRRQKLKGAKEREPVRTLGTTARVAKVGNAEVARFRLARGRCATYAIEAYGGVPRDELKKLVAGLERLSP